MKILVVDDDVDFADGMAEMLTLFGHDVQTAYSCDDGIAAGGRERIDLALIDVGLADRSGADCARGILKSSESTHCILTTGYSADALNRMGISTAEFQVLRKPIKPEDLEPFLKNESPTPPLPE